MSNKIRSLTPGALWNHFADLNAIPRASKKEERVIQFIAAFGKKLDLPTSIDETGNVIIKKPASKGMEDRTTIVLQSHLDMVHQKNGDTEFNFDTEGIKMFVEDDWVKARGTTLGADNGIGVSTIMAILESTDIAHPPIEALFTIDEETGMSGALGLKGGLLDGSILLNLDTEDDHELTIGCAGAIDVTATGKYEEETVAGDVTTLRLTLKGLSGGHSGMEIHKGLGNSNIIMASILSAAVDFGLRIHSIDGGGLRNAIPRESVVELIIPAANLEAFKNFVSGKEKELKSDFASTDPNLSLSTEIASFPSTASNVQFQYTFLKALIASPNGVYKMSPDIPGLVQTSNNVARVLLKDGSFSILCLTRSAVDEEKMELANILRSVFELTGASVAFGGSYPGWAPKPESAIVKLMSDLYRENYHSEPDVNACHAGLECGIIGTNYPHMQMISFGPNILGAHSPDEKVQVSSVQKFWNFLLETLKRIPKK